MSSAADDCETSQNLSSNSVNLRPDAREFVPKRRNQERPESDRGNTEQSSPRRTTGTVPKTFFEDNRRYGQSRRYDKNRNENYYPDRYYESEKPRRNDRPAQDRRRKPDFNENNRPYLSEYSNGGTQMRTDIHQRDRRMPHQRKRQEQPEEKRRDQYERRKLDPPEKKRPANTNWRKEKSIDPSKISQREQLTKDIEKHALECMICMLIIKDHQPIWSCTNCYHILHLNCIRTWIANSKIESGEWRCVACQFLRTEVPKDYHCFCGKEKFPSNNQNDLAHSCGQMCGRTDNCPHPCLIRCHPGPHATCQASVKKVCGCGKELKTFICSMKTNFECEQVCEKTLSCGVHKCKNQCHQGDCQPCNAEIDMECYCGKETKTEVCALENAFVTKYSCNKICDLRLSCDNHNCQQMCHPEICSKCTLSPEKIKSCPCGRKPIEVGQRKRCSDPIPLCKSQCSKALKCGPLGSPHTCAKTCHLVECPPCSKSTNVKCRCGRIEEKILCKDLTNSDVRCKKKCTKFKSCGRHKCNQCCCIELEHPCTQQCGRMLDCKNHRCPAKCHIGNCHPCQRASFDEMRCECGSVVVYPPVPCGAKLPECKKKCIRKHKCPHPVNHLCHNEPECPPCVHLTTQNCYGKHEQRKTIPCNQESFSCGMPCGGSLKCKRHSCIRNCHMKLCETSADVCKQPCITKKKCGHNCGTPCHDGICPEKACKFSVETSCLCGNLKEMKPCVQVEEENFKQHRFKISMQLQNGETIEDLAMKKTTKILECNNDCAIIARNRRLDIAFKVENPNLISYPKFVPNYTEFIRTFFKKEPAFVNMVHEKLSELVKLAKDSKQKSRSYSFPVMNRDKRHAVHDLAAMFGVETQAFDAEPNRNIVATAERETCWLPSLGIAEVLQREIGQRQVRPPMMQTKK